jgi:hypothetical protein
MGTIFLDERHRLIQENNIKMDFRERVEFVSG